MPRENSLSTIAHGFASALDNTVGSVLPGVTNQIVYATARAAGQKPQQANRMARRFSDPISQPFGRTFGVTETQGYKQEATQQLLRFIGVNVNKGAKWLSRQTGLPVGDVESLIQSASMAVPLNRAVPLRRTSAAAPRLSLPADHPVAAPRAQSRQPALPAPDRRLALPAPPKPAAFVADIQPNHTVRRQNVSRGQGNYVVPLSDYAGTMYRETSPTMLQDFIPGSSTYTPQAFGHPEVFLADAPDMALGQGANTGVMLNFDASGLKGKVHTGKPNWNIGLEENLGTEFIAKHNPISAFQNALKSFRIMDYAKLDPSTQRNLQFMLPQLEQQGWRKTVGSNFVQYDAPPKGAK